MVSIWFFLCMSSVATPSVSSTNDVLTCISCDSSNVTCLDGQCVVDVTSTGNCTVCTTGQSKTLVIVLVAVAVSVCLAFLAVFTWLRHKRQKKRKYNMIITTRSPKQKRKTRRKNKNLTEWDFDNNIYETASGVRSLPRVKPCTELKGEQAEYNMKQEFKALPLPDAQSSYCGRLAENFLKNRYKNIIPYDATRVCLALEEEDESDYINASYIDGYRQQTQYIAAQGPTRIMLDDFWKMIWQTEVIKIVMLTNLVEAGRVKCETYWPACGTDYSTYGDVSVQCVEVKVFEHHTFRSLAVWKANCQTRIIHQFHYTSWPAQGVPAEVTSLIDFYKIVKNTSTENEGPTLVHCSAGVGRTGTFLALVYLIEQAKFERRACVYSCVQDIRFQRMEMVNTEEQYLFLYRVLNGALETRGILPDKSAPVWLQCRFCWETDRQHPILNGRLTTNTPLDRDQSNSYACLDELRVQI